jgi:hypothetical protein
MKREQLKLYGDDLRLPPDERRLYTILHDILVLKPAHTGAGFMTRISCRIVYSLLSSGGSLRSSPSSSPFKYYNQHDNQIYKKLIKL